MHQSHSHEHHAMIEDFKKRYFASIVATVPILLLSPMTQEWLHFQLQFPGKKAIVGLLASLVFFYGGYPFLKGFVRELKNMRPAMMTLIGWAISVAYVYSMAVLFGLHGEAFFWELATLIDIMLLGHIIEMNSLLGASKALQKLAALLPAKAHRFINNTAIEDVEREQIKKGDRILVRPGEKIPADGIVREGESEIDEAALTGESTPVAKTVGSSVIAGSINQSGSLTIEVTKDQQETYIARVINMVKEVMASKSGAQDIADKAAFWLTIIALAAGFFTFISWLYLSGSLEKALEHMVTVMVMTCPHALGLAIPLVITNITALTASKGILIRNRRAFESMHNITLVVFDKTGTLTEGRMHVDEILVVGTLSKQDIIRWAASVSIHSEHAIAHAIVDYAHKNSLNPMPIMHFTAIPGKGTKANSEGKKILIGNLALLLQEGFKDSEVAPYRKQLEAVTRQGKTGIFFAFDNNIEGIIVVADIIRASSYKAVKDLMHQGIKLAMITGDNLYVANHVAQQLGITTVLAQILPQDKAREIKKLQEAGHVVAMVGDGINDAPALAAAHVGIAIGAGTDVALETADIILTSNDPHTVVDALHYSAVTRKKMIQNLVWATGYNLLAIPLAAGALYSYGISINPAIGALFMSLSTVLVAINSRFIR